MKSYVGARLSLLARTNEAYKLYRMHTENLPKTVCGLLDEVGQSSLKISSLLQAPVTGRRMLEIGSGQQLIQLAYFGRDNDVTGIDICLAPQRITPHGCAVLVRRNGWLCAGKTIARKIARIDSKARAELLSQLGLSVMPNIRLQQMDAADMAFPDNSFDVVYSRSVFEHLADPAAVISESRRVLKPGGVMFVYLHLHTSDSGCHDNRIFVGRRGLPFWAHLRTEYEHDVRPNSYLNKLRLAEWVGIFRAQMPGSDVVALCDAKDTECNELKKLRSEGQLAEYSDEELLSSTVEVRWRKPLLFTEPCFQR